MLSCMCGKERGYGKGSQEKAGSSGKHRAQNGNERKVANEE